MATPNFCAPPVLSTLHGENVVSNLIALGLVDAEVLALVRDKLSKEQIALLIVATLNPHAKLAVSDQATLAGVNRSTLSRRN